MPDLNPYASPKVAKENRRNFKHWRVSLAYSLPISLAIWALFFALLMPPPTVGHGIGIGATLFGSALGASLGFVRKWLSILGAIVGCTTAFAATVFAYFVFAEPRPDANPQDTPFNPIVGSCVIIGIGFLYGVSVMIIAWFVSLLRRTVTTS